MIFLTACWGEEYVSAATGLIRSFETHCRGHKLYVYTDCPELLPGASVQSNAVYLAESWQSWIDKMPGYYQAQTRRMAVKSALVDHWIRKINGPVGWVDADCLLLDDPGPDLDPMKPNLVVAGNKVSTAFWTMSRDDRERWARLWEQRVMEQDKDPRATAPILERWVQGSRKNRLGRHRFAYHNVFAPSRLYDPNDADHWGPGSIHLDNVYFQRGGFYHGPRRIVLMRFKTEIIDHHLKTQFRAFENGVRDQFNMFYDGV